MSELGCLGGCGEIRSGFYGLGAVDSALEAARKQYSSLEYAFMALTKRGAREALPADCSDIRTELNRLTAIINTDGSSDMKFKEAVETARLVMPKMDRIDALLTGRTQVGGTPTWVWWALAGTVALGAGMLMMRAR